MWSEWRPPTTTQVRDAFGVEVGELRPHSGGFEADAFTDGRWFVKLWRPQPDSDAALALTAELAARGIPRSCGAANSRRLVHLRAHRPALCAVPIRRRSST